jgi:hypothetical protein
MNAPRHWRVPGAWSGCVAFFLLMGFLCSQAFAQTLPTKLGDLDADGQITALDLVRLINHVQSSAGVPPAGRGAGFQPASSLPVARASCPSPFFPSLTSTAMR